MLNKYIPYQKITITFLFLLAFGMSLGKIFMSIASIGLAAAWLLEGGFKDKWNRSKELSHAPIILSGIFLVHVFWLFNTSDFSYAIHDIVLKLPLLSFPIVLGTVEFSKKILNWTILAFISGVLVSTLLSYGVYLEWIPSKRYTGDIRSISLFMSHIRLSLLVCMSIVFLVYFSFKNNYGLLYWIPILWLAYFLFLLSGTGMVILIGLIIYSIIVFVKRSHSTIIKWILALLGVAFIIFTGNYVREQYVEFASIKDTANFSNLESHTPDGEKYIHDVHDKRTDNGYYTWIYIAPDECAEYWNKVSDLPFNSMDSKGQPIKYTIYRYLTSLGLRKDKSGILALSQLDIANIENGKSSAVVMNAIDSRLQKIFFEFREMNYSSGWNGHSVAQRLLFASAGIDIFLDHWVVGVGTGDVPNAFTDKYIELDSPLDADHRLRAHNQLLTFLIAFGVVGFCMILFFWIYPIVKCSRKNVLYGAFLLIILLSFLSDNTLERQAGLTFFAFFNSFLLFHFSKKRTT